MDVTRRLRAIEKERARARLSALPVSTVQDKFRRFLAEAEQEAIDLRPWEKRVKSLARALGFPETAPRRPQLGDWDDCHRTKGD
jgi:hypothetical protein